MKQNVTHCPEDWEMLEPTYMFLWMTESDAICIHRLWDKHALSGKHYFAGHNFYLYTVSTGGQDSPVRVATRYRLDGLGTETQWGGPISMPVQTGPEAHPAFCTIQCATGLSLGVKQPECGADHLSHSSAEGASLPSVSAQASRGDFCLLYLDVDKRSICTGCLWIDTTPGKWGGIVKIAKRFKTSSAELQVYVKHRPA